MRAAWLGAGIISFAVFWALGGCVSSDTTRVSGAGSSGGQGSSVGTAASSGGQGSSVGSSGGQASGVGTSGTSGGLTTGGPCSEYPPCPKGLVCDPAKGGACECYLGGPACGATQICALDGGCIDDPCLGVTCTASGAACYGGECKCGGPNGVLCSAPGESCSPIDNSCVPTSSCATLCPTNEVCNPLDSECHCGTIDGGICGPEPCNVFLVDGGPLAPGEDAGGAAVYYRCSHERPCVGVTCPPFEACDVNNNGACECGGDPADNIPGTVCAADESCVAPLDGGEPTCVPN